MDQGFSILMQPSIHRYRQYDELTVPKKKKCLGIMIAELVQTAKKKEDSYVSVSPLLKFIGLVGILLTAVIFYTMLAGSRDPASNFRVGTILMHLVLPIMYAADWVLFYQKKKVKSTYPLIYKKNRF